MFSDGRERERHGVRPAGMDLDVARGVPVEHFGHAIIEIGDVSLSKMDR
jgi:hypothetical protein